MTLVDGSHDESIAHRRDHFSLLGVGRSVRQAPPPAPVAAAPDGCVVALAPAQGQDRLARKSSRRAGRRRRGPNAKAALERLGYLHVARARVTNDPGHYKLAETVPACLKPRIPARPPRLLLRGHVLHQLHRFNEAEQLARALVAQTDGRAGLRPARRRADGAGAARRSRRRLSADDRPEALLSVVYPRRSRRAG